MSCRSLKQLVQRRSRIPHRLRHFSKSVPLALQYTCGASYFRRRRCEECLGSPTPRRTLCRCQRIASVAGPPQGRRHPQTSGWVGSANRRWSKQFQSSPTEQPTHVFRSLTRRNDRTPERDQRSESPLIGLINATPSGAGTMHHNWALPEALCTPSTLTSVQNRQKVQVEVRTLSH